MKKLFDRGDLDFLPLSDRRNKLEIERDAVDPAVYEVRLSPEAARDVKQAAQELKRAKERGASRLLAFGAHSIKNGLSRVLVDLMEGGWISHFATNGAGIIHDWEFAYQGASGEDVKRYASEGRFGIWEETGAFLNLAIALGAYHGLGYGEAVGEMVARDGLDIPAEAELLAAAASAAAASSAGSKASEESLSRGAAALDLLALLRRAGLPSGFLRIEHPYKRYGLQAACFDSGTPFTAHPMFGHDIIYVHPLCHGAAIGRAAERDFLSFASSIEGLEGGVYLSVGSAVMSPMIFEKSLSMARNLALHRGRRIEDFSIHVVDLAASSWDWKRDGEPPQDDPGYYLRFLKTFSRMGGAMSYASADNRSWLVALLRELES